MLTVLNTIVAGLIATLGMSAVMYGIHATGLTNADMVRALGSLITKGKQKAMSAGFIAHLISGIMFAFPYAIIISAFTQTAISSPLTLGALLGLFHGFVFSFMMIALVAENHPLEEYRSAGVSVAVAHILGHIAYGVLVGMMVYALPISYGFQLNVK
ncbi:MAG: hypothetical protein CMN76_12695 [Spirochaetaceae bacterium]|nr:hypothetical protein [Spirochaetaceae bacterium]|tara:strand:- start:54872 stop:55342 length:471 start_codon:yes stop_codon:yes gene_type:complete